MRVDFYCNGEKIAYLPYENRGIPRENETIILEGAFYRVEGVVWDFDENQIRILLDPVAIHNKDLKVSFSFPGDGVG